jgi:hypothetical protein
MMKSISSRFIRRRPIHKRLRFESLEVRLALATHIWTGAGFCLPPFVEFFA